MHNGRFQTLEEVVEFYNRGGDFDAPNVDHGNIRPLNLSPEEKASLVAFMKRPLTDERVRNELPPFDKPKLYSANQFAFRKFSEQAEPGRADKLRKLRQSNRHLSAIRVLRSEFQMRLEMHKQFWQ